MKSVVLAAAFVGGCGLAGGVEGVLVASSTAVRAVAWLASEAGGLLYLASDWIGGWA